MNFFEVLFDEGEQTCFAKTVKDINIRSAFSDIRPGEQYFSINPLIGSRKDSNVVRYRNFLIEYDNLEPEDQLKRLQDVPYSTLVWSGGKSYHAIISLKEALLDKKDYDEIFKRIQTKLPGLDKANKNPSRLSRIPNVIRSSGIVQKLKEVRGRVDTNTLEDWLGPIPKIAVEPLNQAFKKQGYVPAITQSYLRLGSVKGRRNSDLFKASCVLFESGWSMDKVLEAVIPVAGLPMHEITVTVNSARKTIEEARE